MTLEKEEDVSWGWIAANKWFLALFAFVIASGVELRMSVAQATSRIEQHIAIPYHNGTDVFRAMNEQRAKDIERRLDLMEQRIMDLSDRVSELSSEIRAYMKSNKAQPGVNK